MTIPVFDGHNDFLLRLLRDPKARETTWLTDTGQGHLDLPRMKSGGFAGGFFAVYIPSPHKPGDPDFDTAFDVIPYDLPLPEALPFDYAAPIAVQMMGHLKWLERTGHLDICRNVTDIETAMAAGRIAAILHMEGVEAIDDRLDALHLWHELGLRSLGPVWSRPNAFGHGVPFRYPSSPDTGDGLTDLGKALVRECNALNILVDLSHLNEKGFDDVAKISNAPLVATHSNAHSICPSSRNLTDRQLDTIRDSDGMVGLNFAINFARDDGKKKDFTGFDPYIKQISYLIDKLGEDRVGFGSDFDGCSTSSDLSDASKLQSFLGALRASGFDDELIEKIAYKNWLAILKKTWGS